MNLNGIRGSFFIALKGRILRIREFSMEDQKMNFYHQLDAIMKQDMGGRGLLASLPENPIKKAAESLRHAARVILLTGFPVRMEDGGCIGETDGPSGTATLAFAFTQAGAGGHRPGLLPSPGGSPLLPGSQGGPFHDP